MSQILNSGTAGGGVRVTDESGQVDRSAAQRI